MRVYTPPHRFYAGIDRHARTLHRGALDPAGALARHQNVAAPFLTAIPPFRQDLVVGAECMFAWYGLADLCAREQVPFVLGHALYRKLIYGAKAKSDKIDAAKIARLRRGGTFPLAYVYPKG